MIFESRVNDLRCRCIMKMKNVLIGSIKHRSQDLCILSLLHLFIVTLLVCDCSLPHFQGIALFQH